MKLGKHDMTRSPIRGKEARSGSKGAFWSCLFFGVDLKSHRFQEGAFSELPLRFLSTSLIACCLVFQSRGLRNWGLKIGSFSDGQSYLCGSSGMVLVL